MSIIDGVGVQVTLGSPSLNRHVAILQFKISCPIALALAGETLARLIGDALDSLWTTQYFTTAYGVIRMRVAQFKHIGQQNGRWIAILSVPFQRDETRVIPPTVPLS